MPCRHILAVMMQLPSSRRNLRVHDLCSPAYLVKEMEATWAYGVAVPELTGLPIDPAIVPPPPKSPTRKKGPGRAKSRDRSDEPTAVEVFNQGYCGGGLTDSAVGAAGLHVVQAWADT